MLWLVAACAALVPGAGAAPAVLPQQSGIVDLLTQANVRIDGARLPDLRQASAWPTPAT